MKSLLIKFHKIRTPLEYPTANMLCFVNIFTAVISFLAVIEFKLLKFFSSFIVKLPALDVFFKEKDEEDDYEEEDVINTIEFKPDVPVGRISLAMYGEYIYISLVSFANGLKSQT